MLGAYRSRNSKSKPSHERLPVNLPCRGSPVYPDLEVNPFFEEIGPIFSGRILAAGGRLRPVPILGRGSRRLYSYDWAQVRRPMDRCFHDGNPECR